MGRGRGRGRRTVCGSSGRLELDGPRWLLARSGCSAITSSTSRVAGDRDGDLENHERDERLAGRVLYCRTASSFLDTTGERRMGRGETRCGARRPFGRHGHGSNKPLPATGVVAAWRSGVTRGKRAPLARLSI